MQWQKLRKQYLAPRNYSRRTHFRSNYKFVQSYGDDSHETGGKSSNNINNIDIFLSSNRKSILKDHYTIES